MAEFLKRLRERKIVQWALAYVAAAFALIQVLDVVAQRFGWPESLERVLILALAIGFFITLVLTAGILLRTVRPMRRWTPCAKPSR